MRRTSINPRLAFESDKPQFYGFYILDDEIEPIVSYIKANLNYNGETIPYGGYIYLLRVRGENNRNYYTLRGVSKKARDVAMFVYGQANSEQYNEDHLCRICSKPIPHGSGYCNKHK